MEFIKEFDFLECVGDYSNPLQAVDLIRQKQVDLIFLDIEMPRIKGIPFAEMINDNAVMIVFTTAHPEYALKGYKVNAIDYLLKPIFFDDFKRAVMKARELFDMRFPASESAQFVFFRENGVDHRVMVDDIVYISSLQNYVQVHLADKRSMVVHKTLKSVQEVLPEEKFIQLHRSYLVQKRYVRAIDGLNALVHDTTLPIARERKQALLDLITKGK